MSSASSTSSDSPTPTQSNPPRPTETGIQIPTSTVVAIGGGFVCFALLVLGSLLFVRLIRLFRSSRRDSVPFVEAWRAQGGFFGWLHGVGARDRDGGPGGNLDGAGYLAWLPGGGGWYAQEVARVRMWNEMGRAGRGDNHLELWEGEVPKLWEVGVGHGSGYMFDSREKESGELDGSEEGIGELASYQPFCVGPINMPDKDAKSPPQTPAPQAQVRVSLLIALPSPETKRLSLDSADDEDFDLPDMVMGSMTFSPTVTVPRRRKEGKKGEVTHIEDRNSGQGVEVRRAEWVRRGEKWVIEGLDKEDKEAAEKSR